MKYLNTFLNSFLLLFIMTFTSSCFVADWYYGKSDEAIKKDIDTNKDGKLSTEEIKRSKYDLNKDGIISIDEMTKAKDASTIPSLVIGLLAAFNIPLAAGLKIVNAKLKDNESVSRSLIGGIDDLVALGKDGYSKADIYKAIEISTQKRGDVKKATKMIGEIKEEIRHEKLVEKRSELTVSAIKAPIKKQS